MKKKVLILGASSDIGYETVKFFLKNNWIVIAHFNKNKHKLSKLQIINVSNVFGESIKRIVEGDSLSSMFKV